MARYIAAIDQGTTSTRFIVFDHAGAIVALAQKEHRQIYAAAGLGRARPDGNPGATRSRWSARRWRAPGSAAADLAAVGVTNQRETTVLWDRATGAPLRQCPRLDGHAHRGAGADASPRDGRPGSVPRPNRPAAEHLFLRPEAAWLLDHVPGARAAAESGEALFGTIDSWLAWNLTGGPAAAACHRRHQRHPHPADESRDAAIGTRTCSPPSTFRAPACRGSFVLERGVWRDRAGAAAGRPARRHARRPAGGAGRAGLLRARRGEEHLWHRLLPADEHRRRTPVASTCGPAHHARLQVRRPSRRSTRWKARSRSPARWCNGCATIWA